MPRAGPSLSLTYLPVLGAECDRPLPPRACGVSRGWDRQALEYSKVWVMLPPSLGFPIKPEGSWQEGGGVWVPSEGARGGWGAVVRWGPLVDPLWTGSRGRGSRCCGARGWGPKWGQALGHLGGPRLLVGRVKGRSGTHSQVMGRDCPSRSHGTGAWRPGCSPLLPSSPLGVLGS